MIILTDVDGVLLSWVHSFEWWMKRKGYKKKELSYYIDKQYGISKKQAKVLVEHFCESAAIGFLPPLRDAIKYVRKFHEEHGAVFHAITSFGEERYAMQLREQNLKRVFGENVFERIHCLPCGADKNEALKRYQGSGWIWVEDKTENANLGAEMGLQSFLMSHQYNWNQPLDDRVTRVDTWKEIYEITT